MAAALCQHRSRSVCCPWHRKRRKQTCTTDVKSSAQSLEYAVGAASSTLQNLRVTLACANMQGMKYELSDWDCRAGQRLLLTASSSCTMQLSGPNCTGVRATSSGRCHCGHQVQHAAPKTPLGAFLLFQVHRSGFSHTVVVTGDGIACTAGCRLACFALSMLTHVHAARCSPRFVELGLVRAVLYNHQAAHRLTKD